MLNAVMSRKEIRICGLSVVFEPVLKINLYYRCFKHPCELHYKMRSVYLLEVNSSRI